MVEQFTINYKEKNFKNTVDIFFDRYKLLVEDVRSKSVVIVQFFLSVLLAFLIAYIGWQSQKFIALISTILSVDFSIQYILISAIAMTFIISFILINLIGRIKPIQKIILKILRLDDYDKCMIYLEKLYLIKIDPKGWEIKYELDKEKNILKLVDISYMKPI